MKRPLMAAAMLLGLAAAPWQLAMAQGGAKPAAPAAGAEAEAAPGGPVKIGVLADLSSVYSDMGGTGAIEAVKMAVEDFGGEVLGKKIEVVSADGQNKPDIASAIARKWYDNEAVDMIIDLPTSAIALAVMELANAREKVVMVTEAASSDITGKHCSPFTAQWTWDTYGNAMTMANAVMKQGGDSWFFITADYVFGHSLERDTTKIVTEKGGKVLGSARHPLNTQDFSSLLLQAQNSGAKVIALANGGADTSNAIKQANEFGLTQRGQKLVAMVMTITDVRSIGLDTGKGLVFTEAFYWDKDDRTRAFAKRFMDRTGKMPTMNQAANYSATTHYLKAIKEAGAKDAKTVMAKMRATPIRDPFTDNGVLREDGRMVHSMLLLEIKQPGESKGPWDLYKILAEVPAEESSRPLKDGGCPLVK